MRSEGDQPFSVSIEVQSCYACNLCIVRSTSTSRMADRAAFFSGLRRRSRRCGKSVILKLHDILRYLKPIHSLGSPDGYNTEHAEQPHINYIAQMTPWLQCQVAIHHRSAYIRWIKSSQQAVSDDQLEGIEDLVSGQDDSLQDKCNALHRI